MTGRIENATIYDIAPTILYLSGLPAGKDMDGKVLTGIIDPAFLKRDPVKYIKTYDTAGKGGTEAIRSPADREIVERLKSLGYLE